MRTALPEDLDFLYRLNRLTMKAFFVQTWGTWDELWQREYYARHFRPSACQVIVLGGIDVGVLSTGRTDTELLLEDIQLLPDHQSWGIGTALVKALLTEAHGESKPVTLQVLKVNSRARRFYQRLGFVIVGESKTHDLMEAPPGMSHTRSVPPNND